MTAPTPTSNTIPADDRRNPSYYEMMAGYEKPNLEWYMSEDEEGNRSRPKFTKENFDLVGKVVGWVKKHQLYLEEGQIPNLPRRATWVWGPHRKS
ncbi:hypothetical protein P153DRAFT_258293, partial [Dothidotthia symphoricarpi CBS 119687]